MTVGASSVPPAMLGPRRRRILWAAVVLAVAGAAVSDRLAPAGTLLPAAAAPAEAAVVWACPVLKAADAPGWLHLANAGTRPARARITFVPDGSPPVASTVEVAPGHAATVGVPGEVRPAAGALVEVVGGEVAVSHSLFAALPPSPVAGAAATCQRPGPPALLVPWGSTLQAETTLVLLNPGSADATVDVALLTDGGRVEPESLRGRLVPARGRLAIRLGDFAFDQPAVAALVEARSGRVAAEGLVAASSFLEIVPAVRLAPSATAAAATDRGPASFASVAVGDADAVLDARLLSGAAQTAFEPLAAGLPAERPRLDGTPPAAGPPGPVALALSSTTSPVGLVALWQVRIGQGGSDLASVPGGLPVRRALAVIGVPADLASLRLLLAAPDGAAVVDVDLLTDGGRLRPPELAGLRVEGGRATLLRLPTPAAGTSAVGVVVSCRHGSLVAALEATGAALGRPGAYAVAAVAAERRPARVAVDPRAGIP
jgi:hypothetical protein